MQMDHWTAIDLLVWPAFMALFSVAAAVYCLAGWLGRRHRR